MSIDIPNHAFPNKASAVVIGGGVIGASVAYHLAKLGWSDVVLLERMQFSCGTTWHAAGLIGTMRSDENHAKLAQYSMSLLADIERETGQSTGFKQVGSVSLAHSQARFEELARVASMNNAFGVTRVEMVTPQEIKALYPLVDTGISGGISAGISAGGVDSSGVESPVAPLLGGSWVAQDGYGSPVDITAAFVKGARMRGARCIEGVKVTGIVVEGGGNSATGQAGNSAGNQTGNQAIVRGVHTDHGDIQADYVVNCAGMWAREVGKMARVDVPLHACEHYYAVTEKMDDLPLDLPVLRDHDKCCYFKQDAGSLLVGMFEPNALPWGQKNKHNNKHNDKHNDKAGGGIPADFCFDEINGHFEQQAMPWLEAAIARVPRLQEVGWRQFFCGPESFTPDGQFHIGEAGNVRNFFVAAGLNSIGIQSSGGIGKVVSEWMHHGYAPLDLWGNDIRRMYSFQNTQPYLEKRVTETLGLLYDHHWPNRQMETARNVRHSPIHERLVELNACFGEVAGWERANWFAYKDVGNPPRRSTAADVPAEVAVLAGAPRYEYSFGKQNWFEYSAAEHRAYRDNVALFDLSSFSKYLVQGRDAQPALQRICSANVDVELGKVVYTHWLNERGGIEADLTVTRWREDAFMVVSAAAVTNKDLNWLQRHIAYDAHVTVTDVTAGWAVFGVMGPRSRAFLDEVLNVDLSAAAFPFGMSQEIELGCAVGRAARVSFVGELGWELMIPTDMARHGFDVLWQAGAKYGLRMAGMHALDSGRIEKKFVHFGHDVGDEDTPLECGLGFVCDMDKAIAFIGHDAIARQKQSGSWKKKRLVQFLLSDPEVVLYHHEPILRNGKQVGFLTSGNYGHTLGGAVGLGYVRYGGDDGGGDGKSGGGKNGGGVDADYLSSADFEIEVGGRRIPAKASLTALYDRRAERMRG